MTVVACICILCKSLKWYQQVEGLSLFYLIIFCTQIRFLLRKWIMANDMKILLLDIFWGAWLASLNFLKYWCSNFILYDHCKLSSKLNSCLGCPVWCASFLFMCLTWPSKFGMLLFTCCYTHQCCYNCFSLFLK